MICSENSINNINNMRNTVISSVTSILLVVASYGCSNAQPSHSATSEPADKAQVTEVAHKTAREVVELTQEEFARVVFDYKKRELEFKGKRPCIVDFNAEWCGPCRRLAPIIKDLASEYGDRIDFYSVNIDNTPELTKSLAIQSIPLLLFIPLDGDPQVSEGLLPREDIVSIINSTLLK